MPNRIIRESICTSDSIDALTAFQETVFYRLIVNCDDYGRLDARPAVLKAKLFPLKDMRSSVIAEAIQALSSAELVILYEVDGKPFLQMKSWDRHQQIRAKKSKYPAPGSGKEASDGIGYQLISSDSKCPRNPIQSESNPNPRDDDDIWTGSLLQARARGREAEFSLRQLRHFLAEGRFGDVATASGAASLCEKYHPELVHEALKRTAAAQEKHPMKDPFAYAVTILQRWREAGVETWEDVQRADEQHWEEG